MNTQIKNPVTDLLQAELEMNAAFINRKDVIRSLFLGLIGEENVLLLGPPGEGKSAIVRGFCKILGGSHFEYLLTRFTEPSELTGPKSIVALTEGRTEFQTAGHLPEATSAFLDEVFKCNSACLNSLLTIINERKFSFNPAKGPQAIPLQIVIGASNELPEDEAAAFFDRFLLRHWIGRLSSELDLLNLLTIQGNPEDKIKVTLDAAQLEEIRNLRSQVEIPGKVIAKFIILVQELRENGIDVSSRTMRKILKLAQAQALLNGRMIAKSEDFSFASACLWQKPEQEPQAAAMVARSMFPLKTDLLALRDALMQGFDTVSTVQKNIAANVSTSRSTITIACRTFQDDTCAKIRAELESLEGEHGAQEGIEEIHELIDTLFESADSTMRLALRKRRSGVAALAGEDFE